MFKPLRWLSEKLNSETIIKSNLNIIGIEKKLDPQTEVFIFRIVQEALNNVRLHSKATSVKSTVIFEPKKLKIAIEDNGIGFSSKTTNAELGSMGKLGLLGIQERVYALNGLFRLNTDTGKRNQYFY